MKYFAWNPTKNTQLHTERDVSFEQIVYHIEMGGLLDIVEHPNPSKYPGQRIFIVAIENYAYLVPFVESNTEVFLKTIIPSCKATRKYLRKEANSDVNE